MLIKAINLFLRPLKLRIQATELNEDIDFMDEEFQEIYSKCKDFSVTSVSDMYNLYNSIKYLIDNSIEGDIVECGVWKGGSMMLMAYLLKQSGQCDRRLFLYDTFDGLPEPGDSDVDYKGRKAMDFTGKKGKPNIFKRSKISIEEVRKNMLQTQYPEEGLIFVKGDVRDTISRIRPTKIALLRLDTDWYASTKCELEHLYPLLVKEGVLILDDHGHWLGARKAAIEYFEKKQKILLNKINYSTRIGVK